MEKIAQYLDGVMILFILMVIAVTVTRALSG
ncbi:hypothetical protein VBApiPXC38_41 [Acinetobacter phage VB_ApiP_XC38]|uniref:Uncharacterized protein n=1 Tax=Acinetobacter phage VB_ApiP_XC38 TaxID=2655002 RepID=A0A5P8PR15_9CAUD|nr:hypothetical protein KNU81_gp41 [Acinetobacter phage VB_ApiP_XC38]QFR59728.1 hypothetical protein VBApiPXC38_41 [Acinetobacter phage VB_ApiP_XC38]